MKRWIPAPAERSLRIVRDQFELRSGLLALAQRRMRRGLTVLTYHRVLANAACADYPFASLAISEATFRDEVAWLAANCEVRVLRDALERVDAPRRGRPLVAITFDDGYADNAEIAAPILEAAGLRATFFVCTEFVATGRTLWFDRVAASLSVLQESSSSEAEVGALKLFGSVQREARVQALEEAARAVDGGNLLAQQAQRFLPLTPAQLTNMARAGHEIGSHTARHALLTELEDEELRGELEAAQRSIRDWTGAAPAGLAYPNGNYDARVIGLTRAMGHRYACTTEAGRFTRGTDPWRIARVHVGPRDAQVRGGPSRAEFRRRIGLLGTRLRRTA